MENRDLIALRHRVAFIHPVSAEVVSDIQDLHVGKTHGCEDVIRWFDVGTMAPGATPAIDDDELFARQGLYSLAQLLLTGCTGSGADVLRTRNMRLGIEHMGPDL